MRFHSFILRPLAFVLLLGAWLLIPTSCQRTKPQSPSNRAQEMDSTEMHMALLTQRLVEEANASLVQFVQGLDSAYVLERFGSWHRVTQRVKGERLQKDDKVLLHSQTYTLQGDLLSDTEDVVTVGKREVPVAVDRLLTEMCAGESASLIVPWYAAYGATGNEVVPAYTNIRIEIELTEYDE